MISNPDPELVHEVVLDPEGAKAVLVIDRTIRILVKHGARLVGISTRSGAIANMNGLARLLPPAILQRLRTNGI